jgi:hypothetical protein
MKAKKDQRVWTIDLDSADAINARSTADENEWLHDLMWNMPAAPVLKNKSRLYVDSIAAFSNVSTGHGRTSSTWKLRILGLPTTDALSSSTGGAGSDIIAIGTHTNGETYFYDCNSGSQHNIGIQLHPGASLRNIRLLMEEVRGVPTVGPIGTPNEVSIIQPITLDNSTTTINGIAVPRYNYFLRLLYRLVIVEDPDD